MTAPLTLHPHFCSSNFSWYKNLSTTSVEEYDTIKHWQDPFFQSIFFTLSLYALYNFLASILALTLPVPSGVVIPTFKIGAAMGRIVGEVMCILFPFGLASLSPSQIMPGLYATVGAAAFSGAVTRTVSISVIVFEMTGQVTAAVPVLLGNWI